MVNSYLVSVVTVPRLLCLGPLVPHNSTAITPFSIFALTSLRTLRGHPVLSEGLTESTLAIEPLPEMATVALLTFLAIAQAVFGHPVYVDAFYNLGNGLSSIVVSRVRATVP